MSVDSVIDAGVSVQGNWIGTYGSSGYYYGNYYDTAHPFTLMPEGVTVVYDDTAHGGWDNNSTTPKTLTYSDGQPQAPTYFYDAERPAGAYITFNCSEGFKGTIWVYALDWDVFGPRNLTLTLTDQNDGTSASNVIESYTQGYWTGFVVDIQDGSNVELNVRRTINVGGTNAVISGVFFDESILQQYVYVLTNEARRLTENEAYLSIWDGTEEIPLTQEIWNP